MEYIEFTEKSQALYNNTYGTMLSRLDENGYAATSLTGAYDGMFVRDASIQVMAHVSEGDLDEAKSILKYISNYHSVLKYPYAIHIMNDIKADTYVNVYGENSNESEKRV